MKIVSKSKDRLNCIHNGMIFSFIVNCCFKTQTYYPKEDDVIGYCIDENYTYQVITRNSEIAKLFLSKFDLRRVS
jgi:hypothetical protein